MVAISTFAIFLFLNLVIRNTVEIKSDSAKGNHGDRKNIFLDVFGNLVSQGTGFMQILQ